MTTKTIVTSVPMLDLNAQYAPIQDEVLAAIKETFESKQFIQGPAVEKLEKEMAQYCECEAAVGVSSGTDALIIALMGLDVRPGDEIITTPFTFFATVGSIVRLGATPVFVDIDPQTYTMDPAQIESKITHRTKAIIPVHLFGQMADMDPIMAVARKHQIPVIEDAAQAIGATQINSGVSQKAGAIGKIGCFSFFPSKNLGCCGDGGMVVTQDKDFAEKLKLYRNHGAEQRYYHDVVGGNFRLDSMQAAILSVKLKYLEDQHQRRQENANVYDQHLKGTYQIPSVLEKNTMIYNQYTIRTSNRDQVQAKLNDAKIGNAVYYPIPLHLQNCFKELGYQEGDLPESELAAKEVLSIPIYSELTDSQQEYIIQTLLS